MSLEDANTTVIDGVRAYYDEFARRAAIDMPHTPWPTFDDLNGEQARIWMLCYAANIELSVRISDAMLSLDLAAGTETP